MAQASAHDKQMENLMRTEIFMLCIENRQFQCVDNAARRVDKPAGQQPENRNQAADLAHHGQKEADLSISDLGSAGRCHGNRALLQGNQKRL